ncbi:YopX family protein [Sutcliffiella rhizosphaerae]|uniref:YopX protein domain-containing protein n=1 Tax=Sutcliffiella rhizosphaerae TaxID=2880967 RepID=A0ABM8YLL4_9BACI|nr:YopX family protein [Sutcliffiella rhizosphaerae]CAG9620855.1 hypothetical protein BACCIP111883_01626 [Sutcliffiella rhizosphaerae]
MREFKFRAWEENLKEIIPVKNIDFKKRMINIDSVWRFFDEIKLMQFTGLKDKNGKEIYEGDVIYIYDDDELGDGWGETVIYHRACFMAGDDNLLVNVHFRSVVIGNIYENPELLGQSE